MRVLLVNDRPPGPGSGVEVHIERLTTALAATGDEVAWFAPPKPHRGAAKALDVWDPWVRRRLASTAARFRPDVVHHHNVLRELSVSVLGVPAGAATVLTVHDHRLLRAHEGPEDSRRGTIPLAAKAAKGVLDRAVARRRVDVAVAVSDELAERLRAARFPAVRVVPNFAAPQEAVAPPSASTEVVYAGRLSPEKGLDLLIDAFSRVASARPAASLRIIGDGPVRAELERLASSLAPDRIFFDGLVGEDVVRRRLAGARAVCAPSTRVTEGAPLVVIEAMHAGRPVVGTESPAFRELLGDDERGLVVPWGSAEALAGVLDRLLRDGDLSDRLGRAALARARTHHTPASSVAALHEVYDEAMTHHR